MSIVVPFSKPSTSQIVGSGVTAPPASDPFLLMSAAQMNADRKAKSKEKPSGQTAVGS